MNASRVDAVARRLAGGVVAGLVLALAPATAAYAATTATVTDPGAVSAYTSTSVSVSASSDDATTISSLELFANGSTVGTYTCDPIDVTCSGSVTWAPLTAGSVDLTVTAYDGTTALVTSDPVTVTVGAETAPTISVDTAGGQITGATDIAVTGATGVLQIDEPDTLELYRDGVKVDSFVCPGGASCTHTFTGVGSVPLSKAGASYDYTAKVLTAFKSGGAAARNATTAAATTFTTPQPTISITTPTNGSTIDAPTSPANPTISVTTATAAFLTDKPSTVQLKVGGTSSGGAQSCTGNLTGNSCTVTLPWTVSLSGPYALTAEVTTTGGATRLSGTTNVSVDLPPTATITAPTAGATIKGQISIGVSASTDASAPDKPTGVQLLVNDVVTGSSAPCNGGNTVLNTCTRTIAYDATGKTGPLTLKVRVTTGSGDVGTSAGVQVGVSTPLPLVSITTSFTNPVKGVVSVGVSASTDNALTDFPDKVEVYDGASLVGTVDCVNTSHTCSGSTSWDTTLLDGVHSLTAKVITVGSNGNQPVTVVSSPATSVTVATPAANVSIGTTFDNPTIGPVVVAVSASTDASTTHYPASIALYDGAALVDTYTCTVASSHTCSGTITWDTTGLSGSRSLTAVVTTTDGDNGVTAASPVTSAVTTVDVSTPAPTVGVTVTPISGSSIKGTVTVSVTAAVNPSLTDHPTSITLTKAGLGGSFTGDDTQSCPVPRESSCTLTWTWDATGVTGDRTVTATAGFEKATSTQGTKGVTVSTPAPAVTIDSTFANPTIGLKSVLVSASTDDALSDFPATITLKDGGTPVGVPVQCAGDTHTCSGSVDWDTTGFSGDRSLTATVTTTRSVTQDTAAATTVTVQTPGTDVAVSVTPISGSTIKGAVTISVTASSNPTLTSRKPTSITLSAGGLGGIITGSLTQSCPQPLASSCTLTWTWDTTGQSGARSVSATATLENAATVTASKAVTVSNPLPTVAFVSPSNGTVISKATTIKVTAGTDASLSDFPKTVNLLRNTKVIDTKPCPTPLKHTCSVSFSWSPGTLDGPQAFTSRVTTNKGTVRTTTTRTYYAYYTKTGSSTSISSLSTVSSGSSVTVRGKVIATKTGQGVQGITVRITRDPAIGTTSTSSVTTTSSGAFSLTFTARTNTTITARAVSKTYNGSTWFSGSSRTVRQLVRAPMSCSVGDSSLRKGQVGTGSCVVANLPVGTPLTLTYTINGRTTTLASGTSKSTTISFSFAFPSPGTYTLRVNLGSNAVYTTTSSRGITVTQA